MNFEPKQPLNDRVTENQMKAGLELADSLLREFDYEQSIALIGIAKKALFERMSDEARELETRLKRLSGLMDEIKKV